MNAVAPFCPPALVLLLCGSLFLQSAQMLVEGRSVAMERLERMFGPRSNSTCVGAVDMEALRTMERPLSDMMYRVESPSPYSSHKHRDPVKYFHVGAGTTATRTLFQDYCFATGMTGLHWGTLCPKQRGTSLAVVQWDRRIFSCTQGVRRDCNREEAIRRYYPAYRDSMAAGGAYWSDSPTAETLLDALRLNPELSLIGTYRNPDMWAERRISQHGKSLICSPSLWDKPGVLHPFDFIGCLQAATGPSLYGVIVQLKGMSQEQMKQAYIKMSTINAYYTVLYDRPFVPICAFDSWQPAPIDVLLEAFPELDITGKRAPLPNTG